jgi:hypothetical protein
VVRRVGDGMCRCGGVAGTLLSSMRWSGGATGQRCGREDASVLELFLEGTQLRTKVL